MILSAEEFIRLRSSDDLAQQKRAVSEAATVDTWHKVLDRYPDYKVWVIRNKTVPIEILELLSADGDPKIRAEVAAKRKINKDIISKLAQDQDENVRHALMRNAKLSSDDITLIDTSDSPFLRQALRERQSKK